MIEYKKPFYRIIKPIKSDYSFSELYELDCANDKNSLALAYKLIEKDFLDIIEFVQPHDDNLNTYSHRIYELLLRTCTEFETNCKRILEANGYTMTNILNIKDYYKLNDILQLDFYKVDLKFWPSELKSIYPFKEWEIGHELTWYKAYNKVKHDRSEKFNEANLGVLIQAISGLISILFAQFGQQATNPFDYHLPRRNNIITHKHELENSIFSIYPFESKSKHLVHVYDINLSTWNTQSTKFEKYFSK